MLRLFASLGLLVGTTVVLAEERPSTLPVRDSAQEKRKLVDLRELVMPEKPASSAPTAPEQTPVDVVPDAQPGIPVAVPKLSRGPDTSDQSRREEAAYAKVADAFEKQLKEKFHGKRILIEGVQLSRLISGGSTYTAKVELKARNPSEKPREVVVEVGTDQNPMHPKPSELSKNLGFREPERKKQSPSTAEELAEELKRERKFLDERKGKVVNLLGVGEVFRSGNKVLLFVREAEEHFR